MSAQHTPGPVVKRSEFGGHTVLIYEGHKTYRVIVVGSHVSAACEYDAKPSNWRCSQAFVTVRRELSDGPKLSRLAHEARLAIAKGAGGTA